MLWLKRTMKNLYPSLMCAMIALTSPAFAQRTDDNAVAAAEDAFGKSVGDEQIGIYNAYDVRGFSPVSAGNVRIEGLYFDQQANPTDRLIDGSTVHVGISAQGYRFPAPTGIADYGLRKPGSDTVVSVGLNYGPFKGKSGEFDALLPLAGERLGLSFGAGVYREGTTYGGTPKTISYAASLRFAPAPGIEIQPFFSRIHVTDEESQPLIFMRDAALPKRIRRGQFYGQKWADFAGVFSNYGVVAKAHPAGFELDFGLFRSVSDNREEHADLLFDTDANGVVGQRLIVADRDNGSASTSGEIKLSRSFAEGPRRHSLYASLRARSLDRHYGGADLIDFGPGIIGVEDFRAEPASGYGAKTRDAVHQQTYGIGYGLRWRKIGEVNFGIQKSNYRKSVTDPTQAVLESRDRPWLGSLTAAAYLTDAIALFGGYTRGLEESDVAPSNAINRNAAPPAIRTTQKDFGVRWTISPGVSAILGWFDVRKPYFNLDAASRYRQLGVIRNQGLEFSVSGKIAPGLNLVSGAVLLDSVVSGEEVRAGLIGRKPVGATRLHTVSSVNWNLPWHKPLTLTARFESTSDRTANTANSFVIPARSVTSLGARYRTSLGGAPVLFRATVDNLFNKFGWNVGGSGFFVTNGARRVSLSVAADL